MFPVHTIAFALLRRLARRAFHKKRIPFRCNVCAWDNERPVTDFGRETASCDRCGSTVRMRSVVHLVSMALFGRSIALPDFPDRPDLRGVGLSDWSVYAKGFAQKLDYTNTYYHEEPLLDITKVPTEMESSCDVVVSTDVFEHVLPPVSLAFAGARRLLKPGGTLVLTVPFELGDGTREHFPDLNRFEIVGEGQGRKLVNTRADGQVETFERLVFHGGPGSTLEMRVFSRKSLERELQDAGFVDIRFADADVPEWGIFWEVPWSVPVTAKRA